jgi:hypothetical protein
MTTLIALNLTVSTKGPSCSILERFQSPLDKDQPRWSMLSVQTVILAFRLLTGQRKPTTRHHLPRRLTKGSRDGNYIMEACYRRNHSNRCGHHTQPLIELVL